MTGATRSLITLMRRRWRKLVVRGLRRVAGDDAYLRARGIRRPDATERLGRLGDPERVYDPVSAGEEMPDTFQQLRQRDSVMPVYDPQIGQASDVGWGADDLVIGLELGGEARAYPVRYLDKREMVLDDLGGIPVLVSWCPKCGTALVHRRQLDGQPLVVGNQGGLWGNAMTWWDHDTGSIWSQPLGKCIAGPRKGRKLELLASTLSTWGSWRSSYPATTVLRAPSRAHAYDPADLALVVASADNAVGFPIDKLRAVRVANACLVEAPIVAMVDPGDDNAWSVFSRRLGTATLTFDYRNGLITDRETGSTWDARSGVANAGVHAGKRLERVPSATSLPADFLTFWPDGQVWSRVAAVGSCEAV